MTEENLMHCELEDSFAAASLRSSYFLPILGGTEISGLVNVEFLVNFHHTRRWHPEKQKLELITSLALAAIKFNNYMPLWHLRHVWGVIAYHYQKHWNFFPRNWTIFFKCTPQWGRSKHTSTQSSVAFRADSLSCKLKYIDIKWEINYIVG